MPDRTNGNYRHEGDALGMKRKRDLSSVIDLRFSTSKRFCPGVGRASHCVRGIPDEGRDARLGRTTKGPREVSCCQRHNLPSRHSRFLDAFYQGLVHTSTLCFGSVLYGEGKRWTQGLLLTGFVPCLPQCQPTHRMINRLVSDAVCRVQ